MRRDEGFTLVELLAALVLLAIVLTLGASSLRRYWQVRSLHGAIDVVAEELRSQQQASLTKSHPLVAGTWFKPGTGRWGTVEYDLDDDVCTVRSRRTLDTSVVFETATFAASTPTTKCRAEVAEGGDVQLAFFFARGSATGGHVALAHPEVTPGGRRIDVHPLTGRVTKP